MLIRGNIFPIHHVCLACSHAKHLHWNFDHMVVLEVKSGDHQYQISWQSNQQLLSHFIQSHCRNSVVKGLCDISVVQNYYFFLTRMPSNLDRALRGLRARSVLSDLIAAKSEYPSEFATRLINDTYMQYRKTCLLWES